MRKAIVRIVSTMDITHKSTDDIHVNLFNETYREFQSQMSRIQVTTSFSQLKYLSSESATRVENSVKNTGDYYKNQLELVLPNVTSNLGDIKINAENTVIVLVDSDTQDSTKHHIKIYYISIEMTLIDSYGDNLVLTWGDKSQELLNGVKIDTFELNNSNGDFEIRSYTPII